MEINTAITYWELEKALGLPADLHIKWAEVHLKTGGISLGLEGKVPPGAVTQGGFSPSQRFPGAESDFIPLMYLKERR